MLTDNLVVGQRILHLPVCAVALIGYGLRVVAIIVAREIVLLQRSALIAPERELSIVVKVVFQLVEQLQIDRELRSKLMAPVLVGIALHQGDGVVLLVVRTDIARNGVRIAIGITIEVVSAILVNHVLTLLTLQCDGQCGSQIEC